jgi:hypothetical protein
MIEGGAIFPFFSFATFGHQKSIGKKQIIPFNFLSALIPFEIKDPRYFPSHILFGILFAG